MTDVATLDRIDQTGDVIHGVVHRPLTVNRDDRGSFTEVFCENWNLPIAPVQWSIVSSKPRTLRGMHLHLRHDEYIAVLQGRACVGLYDFRQESPTHGRSMLIELDGATQTCLSFPQGILHGWYFYDSGLHLQAVSEEYSSYGPDDNNGCLWSDPELGIEWPDVSPVLSDRAAAFPTLAELRTMIDRRR